MLLMLAALVLYVCQPIDAFAFQAGQDVVAGGAAGAQCQGIVTQRRARLPAHHHNGRRGLRRQNGLKRHKEHDKDIALAARRGRGK